MSVGQFLRRWGLAIVLGTTALVSWQASERGDTDVVSVERIPYEQSLRTPMLTARRVPRTLQAPVVDERIGGALRALVRSSPPETCLLVQVDDRTLEPASRVDVGLVPASTEKLLTTYAASLVLGLDFRFTTTVAADRPPQDGVVDGDLYLIGSGDPFLSTANWWTQYESTDGRHHTRLEELADRIADAGVVEVTGDLVGDESLFDTERQGPWAERLINGKHSGPLSALTVNEGFADWPEMFISPRQRSETDNPPLHAVAVLNQLLAERGVTVAGLDVGRAPDDAVEITRIQSPLLIDLLTHINSYSSNIGAELLLKRMGVEEVGVGSTQAGAGVVRAALADDGVPVEGLRIDDGSGLAETNLLTCRAVAAVLANAGPGSPFSQTLAISGERGTLSTRMVDTTAEGLVKAKTGTLQDATALSGYAQSRTDPEIDLIFAYIANEPFIAANQPVLELQDTFATALTGYPGRPSVDELMPLPPDVG